MEILLIFTAPSATSFFFLRVGAGTSATGTAASIGTSPIIVFAPAGDAA